MCECVCLCQYQLKTTTSTVKNDLKGTARRETTSKTRRKISYVSRISERKRKTRLALTCWIEPYERTIPAQGTKNRERNERLKCTACVQTNVKRDGEKTSLLLAAMTISGGYVWECSWWLFLCVLYQLSAFYLYWFVPLTVWLCVTLGFRVRVSVIVKALCAQRVHESCLRQVVTAKTTDESDFFPFHFLLKRLFPFSFPSCLRHRPRTNSSYDDQGTAHTLQRPAERKARTHPLLFFLFYPGETDLLCDPSDRLWTGSLSSSSLSSSSLSACISPIQPPSHRSRVM